MPEFKPTSKIIDNIPNLDKLEHSDLIDFQRGLKTIIMDGRRVTQDESGELLGYNAMYESIFVNNWIQAFAINEVNGKTYFNFNAWSGITEKFTKGLIVVEDETNIPMFIIPAFSKMNVDNDTLATLSLYAGKASYANTTQSNQEKNDIINGLARRVDEIIKTEFNRSMLSTLVPDWVYERNNICPEALKAVIYVRDVFNTLENDSDFDNAKAIFTKIYTGKSYSNSEKMFIQKVTNGTFDFNVYKEDSNSEQQSQSTEKKEIEPYQNGLFDD